MPKTNFLFYLNAYNDLHQTSAPALNQFSWSREINGVPYTLSNSQEIQVLPGITSGNILPYSFSNLIASGYFNVYSTNIAAPTTGYITGIAPGQLIVSGAVPLGTYVTAYVNTTVFTVTSANATAGATYTNNGQTFTVTATIVAGTTLTTTQSGAPLASGTLTLATGTGDATITFSSVVGPSLTMSQAATATGLTTFDFYDPATFLYLESDQPVSMIYNGGSPMAIQPFQINGVTAPGVFFMNGPVYSVTITNPGTVAANIYFASMG
jgi:hypothetical protein